MGLICSICGKEAKYVVEIDCGRFNHRFYYCQLHKPEKFELRPFGEKQKDDQKPIRESTFDKLNKTSDFKGKEKSNKMIKDKELNKEAKE